MSKKPSKDDVADFRRFCQQATAEQLIYIYEKERDAGRDDYAAAARLVAAERRINL